MKVLSEEGSPPLDSVPTSIDLRNLCMPAGLNIIIGFRIYIVRADCAVQGWSLSTIIHYGVWLSDSVHFGTHLGYGS